MQAGFAQAEHGYADDLARLPDPGIADIADQKGVITFPLRLHRVVNDFARVVILQKTVVHADAMTRLRMAPYGVDSACRARL